jgi:SMC interacting uncharacterized protein involved in chromosome segregation
MDEQDFEKIESMIARHIGVFAESVNHKFDILVEGHRMLSEKIDRVEERLDRRIDCLEHKLDAVAAQTEKNTVAIQGLSVLTQEHTVAIQGLSAKIDAVAADLAAHRCDTEAHPALYRVKEGN